MKPRTGAHSGFGKQPCVMNWMMKSYRLKNSFLSLTLLCLFTGCNQENKNDSRVASLPYYDEATFTPKWLGQNSDLEKNFHQIPLLNLSIKTAIKSPKKTFEGKIYVADFFFTSCPGICKKMTANMSVLQEEFKNDGEVLLLSHSVTPEIDSVAILAKYGKENRVDIKKWHLVTGNRETIYNLGRNHYFVEEDLGKEKNRSTNSSILKTSY